MYAQNPYGAAVEGLSEAKSANSTKSTFRSAPTNDTNTDRPRDAVLSRVPKRAQISKPPVKISMAPRYRFAIPEPPADLKMLRGQLDSSASAAAVMHKLEMDAKKPLLLLNPSSFLLTDLIMPSQYAVHASSDFLSADDQVILDSIDDLRARNTTVPVATQSQTTKSLTGAALPSSNSFAIGSGRRPMPPPTRSKEVTAHPWMRRMSYDEYFSGTSTHDPRRQSMHGVTTKDPPRKSLELAASRKKDAIASFEKANLRPLKHPDKTKAHLEVVDIVPVFRDLSDVYNEWRIMQFDRMGPLEKIPRFDRSPKLVEDAFQSAVTLCVTDEDNKKVLSCYVPDEDTLPAIAENGNANLELEMHERTREYVVRDAGANPVPSHASTASAANAIRGKRTFILSTMASDDLNIASLSEVPSSWLLAPRQGNLPAVSDPTLALTREHDPPEAKRRRINRVIDVLYGSRR